MGGSSQPGNAAGADVAIRNTHAQAAPDAITPDEVTSGPVVDANRATLPASDSATLALVLDAVRSFLEGHDGLGADHPVTQDRLERLRRVAVLVERD